MYANRLKLALCISLSLLAGFQSFSEDESTAGILDQSFPEPFSDSKTECIVITKHEGSFTSNNGTTGIGIFRLFDNGFIEGEWSTESKPLIVNAKRYYVIKNGIVCFRVFGEAPIQSSTTARVLMNVSGRAEGNGLKGAYRMVI